MSEQAGPALDREIARNVLGEESPRILPYSTDNSAADLLLWRLAKAGVAFKVQELEGRHYCMLWLGREKGLSTGASDSRPLAICRAALELSSKCTLRMPRRLPAGPAPSEARV